VSVVCMGSGSVAVLDVNEQAQGDSVFRINHDKDILNSHSSPTLCGVCDISLLCLGHLCGGVTCLGGSHVLCLGGSHVSWG